MAVSPAQENQKKLGATADVKALNYSKLDDVSVDKSKLITSADSSSLIFKPAQPRVTANVSQSARSKRSRASVPPGSVVDTANRAAQLVFKYISDNEYRSLEMMLEKEKGVIDVTQLKESRMYTALSFAAFKNHSQCFKIIYKHGIKYNIAGGE